MSTENEYLAKTESLQNELEPVCRVITETVKAEAIYLFGSRAYGTPNKALLAKRILLCSLFAGKETG